MPLGISRENPSPLPHVPSLPVHTGKQEPRLLFHILITLRPSFCPKPSLTTGIISDPSVIHYMLCFTCVFSRLTYWRAGQGLELVGSPPCSTHCSVHSRWLTSEVNVVILHACTFRAKSASHATHTAPTPRSAEQMHGFLLPNVRIQVKRRHTFPLCLSWEWGGAQLSGTQAPKASPARLSVCVCNNTDTSHSPHFCPSSHQGTP